MRIGWPFTPGIASLPQRPVMRLFRITKLNMALVMGTLMRVSKPVTQIATVKLRTIPGMMLDMGMLIVADMEILMLLLVVMGKQVMVVVETVTLMEEAMGTLTVVGMVMLMAVVDTAVVIMRRNLIY